MLATEIAGIGGVELPVEVSAIDSFASVTDAAERSLSMVARIPVDLANVYTGNEEAFCDTLVRCRNVSLFLLRTTPPTGSASESPSPGRRQLLTGRDRRPPPRSPASIATIARRREKRKACRVRELIDILKDQPPEAEVELAVVAPVDEHSDDITVDRYSVEGMLPWTDDDSDEMVIWLVGGEEETSTPSSTRSRTTTTTTITSTSTRVTSTESPRLGGPELIDHRTQLASRRHNRPSLRPIAGLASSDVRQQRIVLVFGVLTALFASGYGVMFTALDDFHDEYGIASGSLGIVIAVGFFSSFGAQVLLAPLADRGHARQMVFLGVALDIVGVLGMAVAEDVVLSRTRPPGDGTRRRYSPALRRIIILTDPSTSARTWVACSRPMSPGSPSARRSPPC